VSIWYILSLKIRQPWLKLNPLLTGHPIQQQQQHVQHQQPQQGATIPTSLCVTTMNDIAQTHRNSAPTSTMVKKWRRNRLFSL
jgi:hypothetical protein